MKIEFLKEINLRKFLLYLEELPFTNYPKDTVIDEKDVLSFQYYPGNNYVVAFDNNKDEEKDAKDKDSRLDDKEKIIGHLCVMPLAAKYGYHQDHVVEVHLNVIEDYQNKGIGKAMLAYFLDEVKKNKEKNKIKKIKTKMLARNEPAIKLFESFGFKKEALLKKEWKILIKDGDDEKISYEDGVYMGLLL